MTQDPGPLLIAGAGIGGLTLALCLARRGISAHLVDKAPRLEEVGAGIQLTPNAGRVLDALGLGKSLDSSGLRPASIRMVHGPSGEPLARIPLGPAAEVRWGAPYRLIHRARLQALLSDAVRSAGIPVWLGAEVVDVADTGSRIVAQLRTSTGADTLAASALVGADGIHSAVRRSLKPGSAPQFSGQVAWRAMAPITADSQETQVWLGPRAHLVSYPLDETARLNLVAVVHGREAMDATAESPASLRQGFAKWAKPLRALIASAETWMPWPLYEVLEPGDWGSGRTTLLGDAAHAMLPHLAQGAAMAIEDAAVLADTIADEPADLASAFRRYERRRSPRVARVRLESRRQGQILRMSGLPAAVRNVTLEQMGSERLLTRLDWLYGSAPF